MTYFKTHTNCKFQKGFNRSLVLDIQRQNYTLIPNSMLEIVETLNKKISIEHVKSVYGNENYRIIDEYIDFLNSNEFGMFVDFEEFDLFPEMSNVFEIPSHISNIIIEISDLNILKLNEILICVENLMCRNIQFIAYENIGVETFKNILIQTKNTNLMSIEFVIKNTLEIINFINEIDKYNFRITELLLHDSQKNNIKIIETSFPIKFLEYKINNFSHCGIIGKDYFSVNKEKVLESLNHNSCLHKKISIDKDGYIRNCPSMPQHFGNIRDTTLEEALNQPDFKKYWNVTKDMIEVCKDCEFRHICTDCRAYTERTHFEGDIDLSKPLKCGYNPYTNEWAEWSTNPLKQKAIEYYGMQELIKKDA